MNKQQKAELAASLKRQGKCNCCQAVVTALSDETGLPLETLMQLTSGFAVGMGTMQNSCGALVGAALAAGMKAKGAASIRFTRQISDNFASRCGAIICKDLKGIETGRMLCPCDECVKNAVLAFYDVFGE